MVFFRNQLSNVAVEKSDNSRTFSQQTTRQNQPVVNTFRCSVCAKSFSKEKSLKIHFYIHNTEKSNSCSLYNTSAESHMRALRGEHVETDKKPKSYTCLICNKSLSSANTLRYHTQGHTGKRPFSCSICLRPFSFTKSLEIHKRTHTGEKPNNCSLCSKSFSNGNQLKAHVETHRKPKSYTCLICNKSLSSAKT